MKRSDHILLDHYQCPEEFVHADEWGLPSKKTGFPGFSRDEVCHGKCPAFIPPLKPELPLDDAVGHVRRGKHPIEPPFDLADAVAALRCEKYLQNGNGAGRSNLLKRSVRAAYYAVRPVMPVSVRKHLQRYSLRGWEKRPFPRWPVDTSVEAILELAMALQLRSHKEIPFIWFWPDGAQSCALVTHDVETAKGRDFCEQLMNIDDSYGIKSSFQVVPECRYAVSPAYLRNVVERGFEIDVHDLNHDGNLFRDYDEFKRRAASINMYGKVFETRGFRSAVLYRNVNWFDLLDFEYDMSIPNVAHLDPQGGGCCTTFPYFIGKILEIPVTMTQDYSLFNILCDYSLNLWEAQMSLIREKHGLMSFIVHPDYILEEREQQVYRSLLSRLSELRRDAGVWITLPGKVNEWWRQRSQMSLVKNGSGWKIEGPGRVRARIAHAVLENNKVAYVL